MTTDTKVINFLVEKGLKKDDLLRAKQEMSLFYKQMHLLYKHVGRIRENLVLSTGDMKAEIMVISDKPEKSEVVMGRSGFANYSMYLSIFFNKLNLSYDDIFWTQAIRNPEANLSMTSINEDHEYLVNEIIVVKPTVIIALGTAAISSIAQTPTKIDQAIGKPYSFTAGAEEIPVIPIKHPRSIFDSPDFRKDTAQTWKSLKIIDDLL